MSRTLMAAAIVVGAVLANRLGIATSPDTAFGMCMGLFLTWIGGYERTDK